MNQLKVIFIGNFDPFLSLAIIDILEFYTKSLCLPFHLSLKESRYHVVDADYVFFDSDFGKGKLCHPYLITRKCDSLLFSLSKNDAPNTKCFKNAIHINYTLELSHIKRKLRSAPKQHKRDDFSSNCRSCNRCRLSQKQELFLRYYIDGKSPEFISEVMNINVKGVYHLKVSIKNTLSLLTSQDLHQFAKFYFQGYEF